jgi:hypothetical protein
MKAQETISSSSMEVSDTTFVPPIRSLINGILVTSEQKMQWLIANALGTDLNSSVQLSMKAVSSLINLNAGIYLRYEQQC